MTARLWAMIALLSCVALSELQPVTIVFARVLIGALALILIAMASGPRGRLDARTLGAFCVMAALNIVLPFLLIVWGQTQIPSGLASILNATTPLFAVVFAHLFTDDEKMTPARIAGVAAGFAGVVVLVGPAALGFSQASVLAHLAGIGAAASYAISSVFGRRFARAGIAPLAASALTTTLGALMLAPIAFLLESPLAAFSASWTTWGALFGLGVLSTAGGYVLYFRLLAAAGATNLMLVTFLMPVTTIVLGWLVLSEHLRPAHFAGMALIACGLAAIDGRVFAWVRRSWTRGRLTGGA